MGPCHHCRAEKKENLKVQSKCHVIQILSSSEMCEKSGHKTKDFLA